MALPFWNSNAVVLALFTMAAAVFGAVTVIETELVPPAGSFPRSKLTKAGLLVSALGVVEIRVTWLGKASTIETPFNVAGPALETVRK
jgi:hypothetical protein